MPAFEAPSTSIRPAPAREGRVHLVDPFRLRSGELVRNAALSYLLYGNPDGPAVVALGGISADRHVAGSSPEGPGGWWADTVGPGRGIDTDHCLVIGIDWLGGSPLQLARHGSPDTDRSAIPAPDVDHPVITTADQARALAGVLEAIGIGPVAAFVGSSYGGMVGLAFAAEFPALVDRLVVISAAHRTHAMATAHRSIQRRMVQLGCRNGSCREGLALARALAMTTYRSIPEFEQRFPAGPAGGPDGPRFEVEDYLMARGEHFCERFTPEAFLTLSLSIDLHAVQPGDVTVPVDLVSVDSDTLVPGWLMQELERGLAGPCQHHRIRSLFGHDAFLKETDAIARILTPILDSERNPR
jgi:homoserine O-acetyltransferase